MWRRRLLVADRERGSGEDHLKAQIHNIKHILEGKTVSVVAASYRHGHVEMRADTGSVSGLTALVVFSW